MIQQMSITIIFLLLLLSCNNSKKNNSLATSENNYQLKVLNNKDSFPKSNNVKKDSTVLNKGNQASEQRHAIEEIKIKEKRMPQARYEMLPNYDILNGKPMIQQVDIPIEVLRNNSDTLSSLAVARYKTYDNYFPVSIADDFEKGISTEYIEYPKKLIFRFQVFEDEFSSKPYLTEDIIIRRNNKGKPYAE